jgi:hypothetical protein
MDPKGVLRAQGTCRNGEEAEVVVMETRSSASTAVAVEAVDQAMIYTDTGNHMTDKKVVEPAVVEHSDKAMHVSVVVEYHCMMDYHRKTEDYSANTVAELAKPFYPSGS